MKCESCKFLEVKTIDGKPVYWFCKKLEHKIENSFAMEFHSKRCGI